MKDPVYKRCLCRDDTGRELGAGCPALKRRDGSWNPKHGTWYFALELPRGAGGKRRPRMRRGGFETREDATAALDAARGKLSKGADPSSRVTVGEYLATWLAGRVDLKPTTRRNYRISIGTYLVPLLGHLELGRLQTDDVAGAFAAIRQWNDELAAGRPVRKFQRDVGPAAMQRIRATLRVALNDAVDGGLLAFNPATRVRMESEGSRRKPIAWTPERVTAFWAAYKQRLAVLPPSGRGDHPFLAWRHMSLRPARVMIWTLRDIGQFLEYAEPHRLCPLFELITATGIRRGEACGLRWEDTDLDAAAVSIGRERVQVGWEVVEQEPKSEAGLRTLPVDARTVSVLRAWRRKQIGERLAWGADWADTKLVFTREDGTPWHPDSVTDTFERLAFAAGLPPVGLHALRHGHATYGLAAGIDIKVMQERLGHSTSKLTRDTYTTVLDEVAREASETIAAMIPRRARS